MAIFAVRKQKIANRSLRTATRLSVAALSVFMALSCSIPAARADTKGGVSPVPIIDLPSGNFFGWPPSTTTPWYAYIYNDYMLVTVGWTGALAPPQPPHATGDVAGRISFGTVQGNLRLSQDDNQALLGGVTKLSSVGPPDDSQFPYGWGAGTTSTVGGPEGTYQDYPAYLRALVDGTTQVNVGFDTAQNRLSPTFRQTDGLPGSNADRPLIVGSYNLGANGTVYLEQRVRLQGGLAKFEWTIVNTDTLAHTVGLRWTINQRPAAGFYFVNSDRGVSPRPLVLGADPSTPGVIVPPIPDTLDIFARRADTITDPGFHNRQIFRGLDTTLPVSVYLSDAIEMAPGTATPRGAWLPQAQGIRVPTFETGIATTAYYGNTPLGYVVPPGGRRVVIAYVGPGGTSDLVADDLILSTESPTALPFYPGAAVLPGVMGNTSATLASVAAKFIGTPVRGTDASGNPAVTGVNNQFQIFASVTSQKQRLPDADVPLSGVSVSLTLPPGLRFVTNPATGSPDPSRKLVQPTGTGSTRLGELVGDQTGTASWLVEPTGEVYGPVTYQVAMGVERPNPLSRSIGRTIVIPATPLVELKTGFFQMLGFPFQFDPLLSNNGDPDTIINSLSRPIDEPVLLFRWVPDPLSTTGGGRYVKETKIEPGVAYFYRPAQGGGGKRLLYLRGAQPQALQAPTGNALTVPLQIILEKGWNMISNPYVYEIPLNYLRIVPLENNPSLSSISFSEAVRNNVIRGGVFYYSAAESGYRFFEDLTAALKPWQGYWVYLNTRVSVLFATPTQRDAVVLPDPVNPTPEPATRAQKTMTADSWKLGLVIRSADGKQDASTRIGVAPGASSGQSDYPKPPAPIDSAVRLAITKGDAASRYAQVLKTPGGKASWDLVVEGADQDGVATLLWEGLGVVPKQVRLSITDAQGHTTNLRNASSLRVNIRKGVTSRFVVTAQRQTSQTLAITSLKKVSEGRASGIQSHTFSVRLTQDATITATLKTQNGAVIAVINPGRAAAAGETRLVWNGRSQNGSAVPAGMYRLEVNAISDSGDRVMRDLPVNSVR